MLIHGNNSSFQIALLNADIHHTILIEQITSLRSVRCSGKKGQERARKRGHSKIVEVCRNGRVRIDLETKRFAIFPTVRNINYQKIYKKITFIKNLLEFLGVKIEFPITVWCDNVGAIFLS